MLEKHTPLLGIYLKNKIQLVEYQGWKTVKIFRSLQDEKKQLTAGSVLADWSFLGKFHLRGKAAAKIVATIAKGADKMKIETALVQSDTCILRLLADRFLILCPPKKEDSIEKLLIQKKAPYNNVSGAWGCLALAGKKKEQVLSRSSAMNLSQENLQVGCVLQTSIHTITTTIYRTKEVDLLICDRAYLESLFDALIDVGKRVGMVPTGISVLPLSLA